MNLNQITVPSLDLTISVPFYQKLGLRLIVDSIPYYARFECSEGNSTFSIHKTESLPKGEGIHIYFECENLDEQIHKLKNNGIVLEQEPIYQVWMWKEARLKDPDGNQIILYFGGEYRVNPPWRVNS